MKFLFLIALISVSCNSNKKQKIAKIIFNPKNYGWYFIEIKKESIPENLFTIKIEFDSLQRFRIINSNSFNTYNYKAYDHNGNEISKRIKLAGILLHYSGRAFFEFYNPSDMELQEIKDWLPINPEYKKIMDRKNQTLDSLLKGA